MAAQDLVSLAEAEEFLRTGAEESVALQAAITRASDWIEQLTRRKLAERTYTNLRLTGPVSTKLYPPAWPINVSQTVTISLDEVAQTVWRSESDGDVDSKDVVVASDDPWDERFGLRNHFYRWQGWASALGLYWRERSNAPSSTQFGQYRVLLSYTGGYNPVPEDLKLACLYLLQKVYARDQAKQLAGVASLTFPSGSTGFVQLTDSAIPREVWALIAPYRRPDAIGVA